MQITSQNTQDETISSTLDQAVITLRHEGLVAFPTETVYGLGADGLNPRAVERVFHLKGRPKNNPLILHVYDLAQARSLANTWLPEAEKLAEKFWPGPLTIALHKAPHVPSIVTGGGESVAIRCPDHPLTLELSDVSPGRWWALVPIHQVESLPQLRLTFAVILHLRKCSSSMAEPAARESNQL